MGKQTEMWVYNGRLCAGVGKKGVEITQRNEEMMDKENPIQEGK